MAKSEIGKSTMLPWNDGSAGAANAITVIHAGTAGSLVVPHGTLLLDADFVRQGSDLLLVGPDGTQILIEDYFAMAYPPALMTAGGAVLQPGLVARLAGPLAPGQYAQLSPDTDNEPIGEALTVDDLVTATRADGTEVTLQVGDPVFQGDVIETDGSGGGVGIVFIDDTTFSLGEDARKVLDEMIYDPASGDGSAIFSMVQGAFVFITGEIASNNPEGMIVETPVATIGIRGTKVAGIAAQEGELNTVTLLSEDDGSVGKILISNAGGQTLLTAANQSTQVTSFSAAPVVIQLSATEIESSYGNVLRVQQTTEDRSARARQDNNEDGADGEGDEEGGEGGEAEDGDEGEASEDGNAEGEAGDGEGEGDGESEDGEEGEGDGEEETEGSIDGEGEGEPGPEGEGEPGPESEAALDGDGEPGPEDEGGPGPDGDGEGDLALDGEGGPGPEGEGGPGPDGDGDPNLQGDGDPALVGGGNPALQGDGDGGGDPALVGDGNGEFAGDPAFVDGGGDVAGDPALDGSAAGDLSLDGGGTGDPTLDGGGGGDFANGPAPDGGADTFGGDTTSDFGSAYDSGGDPFSSSSYDSYDGGGLDGGLDGGLGGFVDPYAPPPDPDPYDGGDTGSSDDGPPPEEIVVPNGRPFAIGDLVITNITGGSSFPMSIPKFALLANDSDPDADPLNLVSVSGEVGGSGALSGGDIIFTPVGGSFLGTPAGTFNYFINDGTGFANSTDVAGVSIDAISGTTLTGTAADEIFIGNNTADTITGNAGHDFVFAGAGNDTLVASTGAGNDHYDGGTGNDTITYASDSFGVTVDLISQSAFGNGATIGS